MAKKAQAKEKVYNFVQIYECKKCGTGIINPGPCEKCNHLTFQVYVTVVERK